jgi:hypothetical protein
MRYGEEPERWLTASSSLLASLDIVFFNVFGGDLNSRHRVASEELALERPFAS